MVTYFTGLIAALTSPGSLECPGCLVLHAPALAAQHERVIVRVRVSHVRPQHRTRCKLKTANFSSWDADGGSAANRRACMEDTEGQAARQLGRWDTQSSAQPKLSST